MLARLQGIDNLQMVPVVWGANANCVDRLISQQVVVVNVAFGGDPGLLDNKVTDLVFLRLENFTHGNEIDIRPGSSQLGKRFDVGSEPTATSADEPNADPGICVGGPA